MNSKLTKVPEMLRNATFCSITRNIARLLKTPISHCFIYVFEQPIFLLIRGCVVKTLDEMHVNFFIIHVTVDSVELNTQIEADANKLSDGFAQ
jgi:hypothetical protein